MKRSVAYHTLGKLKSKAAYRSIPMPPVVVNALREWSLACPKGDAGLVFPSGAGKVESHSNIVQRGFDPIQVAAGVVVMRPGVDKDGQPIEVAVAKYGLHALRHACASLWIENGMNPKRIQKLMGHSSITMTFDTYGSWFKDDDADQKAAADIQAPLIGS